MIRSKSKQTQKELVKSVEKNLQDIYLCQDLMEFAK